ncbi:MAG: ketoacyl-ACP synthase III [Betaproteobacteria bacterium]|jgi:3-oxoacyl-[acyl-carrier-protein] synthase III|nr:ketoacyl-ACP synthase III [Betaproteobacteria bacterium]
MSRYARIVGTGSHLPARRLSNQDLVDQLASRGLESSDEWIVERTGIQARHFVDDGVQTSDLACAAARQALDAAALKLSDIDLIIVATSTPDMVFPSTACIVQNKLALQEEGASAFRGAAFDVQAVCAGFVYAMSIADAMIRAGSAQTALVIGAEVFSRLLDFNDRTTCVLFGDGAGAVVLQAGDKPGILATDIHSDGKHVDILCVPGQIHGGSVTGDPFLRMDGQAVFKLAVGVLEQTARASLAKAHLGAEQLDWLVPHQANVRIIQSTAKKLGMPMSKVILTLTEQGNTSAASIPLALDHGLRQGLIKPGHRVMLEGVGGGFTWGSVLFECV